MSWSGGEPLITRSSESAGGTTAQVTVEAGTERGTTTVSSPLYRIEVPDGADKTCRGDVDVHVSPTKDVVVIGWVDPAPIDLDALAQNANLLLRGILNTPLLCSLQLAEWAIGNRSDVFSEGDRVYANGFLLKNSPNQPPPATIDSDQELAEGDYRLFNRLRVVFNEPGTTDFEILPESATAVGTTPDPCGLVGNAGPEVHPSSGASGLTNSGNGVFQLAEGRLGTAGQLVDLTLNDCDLVLAFCTNIVSDVGKTTPWIWSAIRFDLDGNLSPLDNQIFPTYAVYEDNERVNQFPQSDAEVFIALDDTSERLPSEIP